MTTMALSLPFSLWSSHIHLVNNKAGRAADMQLLLSWHHELVPPGWYQQQTQASRSVTTQKE